MVLTKHCLVVDFITVYHASEDDEIKQLGNVIILEDWPSHSKATNCRGGCSWTIPNC